MASPGQEQKELLKAPLSVGHSWGRATVVLSAVLPFFATCFVILRFVSRKLKRVPFGADDWVISQYQFLFYLECVVGILSVVLGGMGHYPDTLDPSVEINLHKLLIAIQVTYVTSLGFVKVSVCLLLNRVFAVNRAFRNTIWVILGFAVAWMVMNILTAFLTCRPFSYNWHRGPGIEGTCGNVQATFIAVAVLDVLVDAAILTCPLVPLWRLEIPLGNKIALTALFTLGTFDIVIGILRVVSNTHVNFATDWTVTLAEDYFWSIMEPGLACCAASAVVCLPLLERFLPKSVMAKLRLAAGGSYKTDSYGKLQEGSHQLTPMGAGGHTRSTAGLKMNSETGSLKSLTPRDEELVFTDERSRDWYNGGKSAGPAADDVHGIDVRRDVTVREERVRQLR